MESYKVKLKKDHILNIFKTGEIYTVIEHSLQNGDYTLVDSLNNSYTIPMEKFEDNFEKIN